MNIRLATSEDSRAWDEVVLGNANPSFLQTWAWGDFQLALGRKVWRYVLEDTGIVGIALVIRQDLPLGKCWLYVPMVSVHTESARQMLEDELKKLAKSEQAIFVRMDFTSEKIQLPATWRPAPRQVQPKDTLLLDLRRSEEELLAGMHHKTRYNIRLAQKHGVTVRFSTDSKDVEAFLQLAAGVAKRSGFNYHPAEYYRKLIEVLGPLGMAELVVAEYNGQVLAVHMMVYAAGRATYLHGASDIAERKLMAPQLLYWETMKRAQMKGCTMFDFYGVAPENADNNHPWAGITRTKMGFGGQRVSYAGAYDLVLKPLWYWGMNMVRSWRGA
jgi:lipid II:glycine glycyltransferase (peptidoglycan interpeptide bridge formation enzyme)